MSLPLERLDVPLNLDPRRVLLKPYGDPRSEHGRHIVERVLAIPEQDLPGLLEQVMLDFQHRHRDITTRLQKRFEQLRLQGTFSEDRRAMLGACFSCEYSIEAAALFNPSIVAHPDQSGVQSGELRFVLSLRCTGEGHISSIGFRTGTLTASADVKLDPPAKYCVPPDLVWQEGADFEAAFDAPIEEQVLFPVTAAQRNGIEDVRFVQCGERYYGTYTAYDGHNILPQMVETDDFRNYRFVTLKGNAVKNKGMALFPRKLNGQFVMLGRQDGWSLTLMRSDDVHTWERAEPLVGPRFPWEIVQIGNCGSPLETDGGWLVITHGVGPVRQYCIGAFLLDKEDPSKLIASLQEPLIKPNVDEREGYVPNVVYSCGSILHQGKLFVPYAMSDSACRFARIELNALLDAMH